MSGTFGYLLGALGGVAAAFLLVPLLKGRDFSLGKKTLLAVLLALVPALVAFGIYQRTGSPWLSGPVLQRPAATAGAPPHAGPAGEAGAAGAAGSMEEAVGRLESRAAAGQASDADWTLLAQSYEFLGRTEEAAKARRHEVSPSAGAPSAAESSPAAASPAGGTAIARAEQAAAQLEAAVRRNPKDVASWFELAQARRVARDFDRANEAYEKALALEPRNADAWADYADSLASTGSRSLAGKPAKAIEKALALNPNHVKALWLAASLSLEQKRYPDALAQWQRLRAALPPGSPDIAIIDSNIAEARGLAGAPRAASTSAPAAASVAVIEGSVDVAAAFRPKVEAGMTLFIYAKTADGKGPPLAVLRQPVGAWPVRFRLDDSLAMLPGRTISSVEQVLVEARLSRSGNAIAEKGDLLAPGVSLKVRGARPLQLVIGKSVD